MTFENRYTQPDFCRFLDQSLHLSYVGTLAETDKVNLKTGETTLQDFAIRLKKEHQEAIKDGKPPVFHQIRIPFKVRQKLIIAIVRHIAFPIWTDNAW